MDEWIKKMPHTHTHTHTEREREWNSIQPQKEGNPAICESMDGLESITVHEMSDRERQTIDNVTYVWTLKKNS